MPMHRLDIVSQPAALVDEYLITDDDILVDPTTALPMANWSNLGTVVNKVDIRYDFNEATKRSDFSRRQVYTATKSVDRYSAQPAVIADFRGIHTSSGGQAIIDRFALL